VFITYTKILLKLSVFYLNIKYLDYFIDMYKKVIIKVNDCIPQK